MLNSQSARRQELPSGGFKPPCSDKEEKETAGKGVVVVPTELFIFTHGVRTRTLKSLNGAEGSCVYSFVDFILSFWAAKSRETTGVRGLAKWPYVRSYDSKNPGHNPRICFLPSLLQCRLLPCVKFTMPQISRSASFVQGR